MGVIVIFTGSPEGLQPVPILIHKSAFRYACHLCRVINESCNSFSGIHVVYFFLNSIFGSDTVIVDFYICVVKVCRFCSEASPKDVLLYHLILYADMECRALPIIIIQGCHILWMFIIWSGILSIVICVKVIIAYARLAIKIDNQRRTECICFPTIVPSRCCYSIRCDTNHVPPKPRLDGGQIGISRLPVINPFYGKVICTACRKLMRIECLVIRDIRIDCNRVAHHQDVRFGLTVRSIRRPSVLYRKNIVLMHLITLFDTVNRHDIDRKCLRHKLCAGFIHLRFCNLSDLSVVLLMKKRELLGSFSQFFRAELLAFREFNRHMDTASVCRLHLIVFRVAECDIKADRILDLIFSALFFRNGKGLPLADFANPHRSVLREHAFVDLYANDNACAGLRFKTLRGHLHFGFLCLALDRFCLLIRFLRNTRCLFS